MGFHIKAATESTSTTHGINTGSTRDQHGRTWADAEQIPAPKRTGSDSNTDGGVGNAQPTRLATTDRHHLSLPRLLAEARFAPVGALKRGG